ncbi:DUF6708 domain-containing protein [Pseudomonas sp. NPDC088322]|uniref:DUF6708 domain-containing protein n=1 Tax=Pseudomonas sp. NPDC088322 TaxID=3364452 RepID=UPI003820CA5C
MYFLEWLSWQGMLETPATRRNDSASDQPNKKPRNAPYESDITEEHIASRLSVSTTPRTRGPVFAFGNHVLELRCGLWEAKRGLLTILTAIVVRVLSGFFYILITLSIQHINAVLENTGEQHWSTVLLIMALGFLTLAGGYLYLKYGLRFTRLEIFTSRHMLIRFNRTTQQVHLHRPSYCGGIVTLPWEGVIYSGINMKSNAAGMGTPLSLHWPVSVTGTLHPEFAFVGKMCNNSSEMHDEWEFIRRFMESGPDGLPRTRITSHFPWPWQAFTPQFEGLTHYFRHSSRIIKLGLVLISPAFLILGLSHWLSLLLCWKPRWPKIIREAGLPGKPIPPLTTLADRPPHIQERLRENAHLWAIRPGQRPAKKPRAARRPAKADNRCITAEESFTDELHRSDGQSR